MSTMTFNNFINLEYPDGFKVLTDEENSYFFTGNQLRLSFHNKEKHILISLSKSNDSFMNRILSLKAVSNGAINNLKSSLQDFKLIKEDNSTICNEPSLTSCFSYRVSDSDIMQYGELSIFKYKKSFYSVYSISRLEDKEESIKIFTSFRDSLLIKNN